jgi:polyphenol oxidase
VGDERANIVENRRRLFDVMGLPVESIYDAWQVHSTDVICTDKPRPLDAPHEKADAILTNQPGITLFMRFADCVPVVLFDPVKRVVGLVHAGWRGTVDRAAGVAVNRMAERYGSHPEDVLACVGPSICAAHYEVGADVQTAVQAAFGDKADGLLLQKANGLHFDLWSANRMALEEAGVRQIEVAGLCTACQNEDWFSHRAEHGKTGRFGAIIALA